MLTLVGKGLRRTRNALLRALDPFWSHSWTFWAFWTVRNEIFDVKKSLCKIPLETCWPHYGAPLIVSTWGPKKSPVSGPPSVNASPQCKWFSTPLVVRTLNSFRPPGRSSNCWFRPGPSGKPCTRYRLSLYCLYLISVPLCTCLWAF